MTTANLLHSIPHLPLADRFLVVEQTLKSIKKEEFKNKMELAAVRLYSDYANDKELTAFTSLDYENFYETR